MSDPTLDSFDTDRLAVVRRCWPAETSDQWMPAAYEAGLASVIVPVFNRASLISRALDSVAAQSYRPIELIVVDDGSTDMTVAAVRGWMDQHPELRCRLIEAANGGAASARNIGAAHCVGEFIQYLDSDDVLHPARLAIHTQILRDDPDLAYVASPHGAFTDSPDEEFYRAPSAQDIAQATTVERPVGVLGASFAVWCGLYRRAPHIAAGPEDTSLKRWEDIEFMARFTALRPNVAYVDITLYAQGADAEARTHDLYRTINGISEGIKALQRIESDLDMIGEPLGSISRIAVSTFYLGVASQALEHGDAKTAIDMFAAARRNRRDRNFVRRVMAIESLCRIGLSRIAYRMFKGYTNARIGKTGSGSG